MHGESPSSALFQPWGHKYSGNSPSVQWESQTHKQAITMESAQGGSKSKQRVFSDLGGSAPALRWESFWRRGQLNLNIRISQGKKRRRMIRQKEVREKRPRNRLERGTWWHLHLPRTYREMLGEKAGEEASRVMSKSWGPWISPRRLEMPWRVLSRDVTNHACWNGRPDFLRVEDRGQWMWTQQKRELVFALYLQGSPSLYSRGVKVEVAVEPSLGFHSSPLLVLFIKVKHRPTQILNRLHLFMGEEANFSSHLRMHHPLLSYPLKSSATE